MHGEKENSDGEDSEVIMRAAFILMFVVTMVLDIASLYVLPDRVAIHFTFGGTPDNWAPRSVNVLFFFGMHSLLFLTFYFLPRLMLKLPLGLINLPNKDYWFQAAHRPQAEERFRKLIWEFGAAIFLFLFVVEVLVIQANLVEPVLLNEKAFLYALGAFLIYTVCWCVSLFRAFRVTPKMNTMGQG